MSYPTYPDVSLTPGLAWPITRTPLFQTQAQTSKSGRRSAKADWPFPLYRWELTYNFMRTNQANIDPLTGFSELSLLAGFYAQMQGSFGAFLYKDLADNMVSSQRIGIGDGATTAFQLVRTYGGFTDIVQTPQGTPQIFVNGVSVAGFTLGRTGVITFGSAPAAAAVITASFAYNFLVRFADDSYDFSNDALNIWSLPKVALEGVRL